jgi:hypothetical protein
MVLSLIYYDKPALSNETLHFVIMGNESICPGCKAKFINGRPYSVHIRLCKNIDSAANNALKKHKIITAKKYEEKKAAVAARRESAAHAAQALQDGQEMDLEVDIQEVRHGYLAVFIAFKDLF